MYRDISESQSYLLFKDDDLWSGHLGHLKTVRDFPIPLALGSYWSLVSLLSVYLNARSPAAQVGLTNLNVLDSAIACRGWPITSDRLTCVTCVGEKFYTCYFSLFLIFSISLCPIIAVECAAPRHRSTFMSLPLFPPVLRLYEVANGCERVEAPWVSFFFLQERTLMFFFRGGILILRIESSIKRIYIEIFPIFTLHM